MPNSIRSMNVRSLTLIVALIAIVALGACSGKKKPLESFAEQQKKQMPHGSAYVEADFDFWVSSYEPSIDDLERFRTAWVEHASAVPESKAFSLVEKEVSKSSQKVVMVALFMSDYTNADLKNKSLGWVVSPVPQKITELSETDLLIRTLMPVENPWARYFLLQYSPATWAQGGPFMVSNRTSSVVPKKN